MIHDATGWWLRDAGLEGVVPRPSLSGWVDAEVVIVGGGYTGMWTAWFLSDVIGPERIVLLESQICGTGPSGRNGGFLDGLAGTAEEIERHFGREAARALIERSEVEPSRIAQWSKSERVDVEFRAGGGMTVSCCPAQDGVGQSAVEACARLGLGEPFIRFGPEEVRSRCDSPLFRGALFNPSSATVHPGRLALGLRGALIDRGVRIFEGSSTKRIEVTGGSAVATTSGGKVRAAAGVLSAGCASGGWPGLRNEITMTSSHMVITEPVPHILEQLHWTGGEAIIDGRTLVHYFRTTRDGRIAFGWGGGRISRGTSPRRRESVDPILRRRVQEDLVGFFPDLAGVAIEHAWGGPIDASPRHLPAVRPLGEGTWHSCFGYTGNGVGPSGLCASLLAAKALDRSCDPGPLGALFVDQPQRVPPEPLRWAGGSLIMGAIDRRERTEARGEEPGRIDAAVSRIPEFLGYSIGR